MINPGYTRLEEVIYKVKDTYGLTADYSSAKEHVWDIMSNVFCEDMLEERVREIDISSYQGVLPEDFYNGTGMMIREKKTGYPLTESTDSFLYYGGNSNTTGGSDGILITYGESVNLPAGFEDSTVYASIIPKNRDYDKYTYKLNGDLIRCGIENCTLEMAYKAFPMYEDFTPKIPNDSKVIEMCVDYIAFKIVGKLYLKDEISRDKKDWIESLTYWSRAAAKTKASMPSVARMEQIKNRVISMIPRPNEFNNGFKDLDNIDTLRI